MNIVDILIVLLVLGTILRGIEIGFVRQIGSLIGLVSGIIIGGWVASLTSLRPEFSLVIIILVTIICVGLCEIGALKLKRLLHERKVNHVDRAVGGAMGIVTCLALVWLGSALLSALPARDLQQGIRDSRIIAWLDANLPPASTVIAQFEQSLARTGLPNLLNETEPRLDPDNTQLRPLSAYESVIAETRDSIFEIEGRSCQGIGVGSGFVVAPDLVVTNAHVVAGMRDPYVRTDIGRQRAAVVAFDSTLDIAVLKITASRSQPLALNDAVAEVGSDGVVLGYPGGGPFAARPARVADTFQALGRDIYEERPTQRTVLALRADIEPGNSGGPLVATDGSVIGVIFARSTAYQGVGYAVPTPDVASVVERAKTSPSRGDSLRCL